jgi:hypothetical protein
MLRVGWAQANSNSKLPKLEPADSAQIHFSYLTHQTDNVINEETIRALFSRYGEIKDVAIKKAEYNHVLSSSCILPNNFLNKSSVGDSKAKWLRLSSFSFNSSWN